jgi:transposase
MVTVLEGLTQLAESPRTGRLSNMGPGRLADVLLTWRHERDPDFWAGVQVVTMDEFSRSTTAGDDALSPSGKILDPFHVVHLAGGSIAWNFCGALARLQGIRVFCQDLIGAYGEPCTGPGSKKLSDRVTTTLRKDLTVGLEELAILRRTLCRWQAGFLGYFNIGAGRRAVRGNQRTSGTYTRDRPVVQLGLLHLWSLIHSGKIRGAVDAF